MLKTYKKTLIWFTLIFVLLMCKIVVGAPPTFDEKLPNRITVHSGDFLNYQVNSSDPENDTVTYIDDTILFDIDSSTGLMYYQPIPTDQQTYTITITLQTIDANVSDSFNLEVIATPRTITYAGGTSTAYYNEFSTDYMCNKTLEFIKKHTFIDRETGETEIRYVEDDIAELQDLIYTEIEVPVSDIVIESYINYSDSYCNFTMAEEVVLPEVLPVKEEIVRPFAVTGEVVRVPAVAPKGLNETTPLRKPINLGTIKLPRITTYFLEIETIRYAGLEVFQITGYRTYAPPTLFLVVLISVIISFLLIAKRIKRKG